MKIKQKKAKFEPITITLETAEEAENMWEIVSGYELSMPKDKDALILSVRLGDYFSESAKL